MPQRRRVRPAVPVPVSPSNHMIPTTTCGPERTCLFRQVLGKDRVRRQVAPRGLVHGPPMAVARQRQRTAALGVDRRRGGGSHVVDDCQVKGFGRLAVTRDGRGGGGRRAGIVHAGEKIHRRHDGQTSGLQARVQRPRTKTWVSAVSCPPSPIIPSTASRSGGGGSCARRPYLCRTGDLRPGWHPQRLQQCHRRPNGPVIFYDHVDSSAVVTVLVHGGRVGGDVHVRPPYRALLDWLHGPPAHGHHRPPHTAP